MMVFNLWPYASFELVVSFPSKDPPSCKMGYFTAILGEQQVQCTASTMGYFTAILGEHQVCSGQANKLQLQMEGFSCWRRVIKHFNSAANLSMDSRSGKKGSLFFFSSQLVFKSILLLRVMSVKEFWSPNLTSNNLKGTCNAHCIRPYKQPRILPAYALPSHSISPWRLKGF